MPCPFFIFNWNIKMSSCFRIYDLKVSFYGSPNDMYIIEHNGNSMVMPYARGTKLFIERHLTISHNHVYKVLIAQLEQNGYHVAFYEDSYPTAWIGQEISTEEAEYRKEQIIRKKAIEKIQEGFWGNIIHQELFDGRY